MTKHLIISFCACVALTTAHTQDCAKFLFLQKDKTVEISIYDKKGEPNGRQVYQVSNVAASGGATTGTINSEIFDKKGNSKGKANSTITCNGGEMRIDMKLLLPPQENAQFGMNAEVNAQNSYLSYPANMKVGDQLPDGNLSIDLSRNGSSGPGAAPPAGGPPAGGPPPPPGLAKSLTMVVSNRKIDAQESVTTSAGTWDCFRISFKSKITVKTGPFGFPVNLDGVEWYAPGFGIVKSQSKYGGTAITSIK